MTAYVPSVTVADFLLDEREWTFIVGPVGSGKTVGSLMKIAHRAKLQAPSPEDGIRHSRWVVVRNTLVQLKDTTLKSFFQWYPDGIAGNWVAGTNTFWLRFDDVEAEVMFRPLDTPDDVRRVLSLEVTGAMVDEFVEVPQEIIEALSSRCGRYPSKKDGGASWWGMWGASNPGNEDSWWFDWLYEPWENDPQGIAKDRKLGYYQQPSGFSPDADNLDNLPGGQGYYHRLAEGRSDAWIKQFIEVRWGYSLKGKPVYKAFNPDLHIAKQTIPYNPHLPLLVGFDAGLTPAAVLGQLWPDGRLRILAEVTSENMGAKRFCHEKFKPVLAMRFPRPLLRFAADPAVTQRAQTDERSVREEVEKALGIRVHPARSNTLAARLGAVEHFLCTLTDTGPAMIIDPSCTMLIRGFRSGYRYSQNTKGITSDSPEKNIYSHVHDALQYLAMEAIGGEVRESRARMAAGVRFGPNTNAYSY